MTTIARKAAEEIAEALLSLIYDRERATEAVTNRIQRAIDASHEWQPIETAPKDGTHFLAYEETGDMYRAAYSRDGTLQSFCGQYVTVTPEPTHWMPLPAPPKGDAA